MIKSTTQNIHYFRFVVCVCVCMHKQANSKAITHYDTKQRLYHCVMDTRYLPTTLELRSPSLLGRCSSQLDKNRAGANVQNGREGRVFLLQQYLASKWRIVVGDSLSNAWN
jgi:hypothetical protein